MGFDNSTVQDFRILQRGVLAAPCSDGFPDESKSVSLTQVFPIPQVKTWKVSH